MSQYNILKITLPRQQHPNTLSYKEKDIGGFGTGPPAPPSSSYQLPLHQVPGALPHPKTSVPLPATYIRV